MAPALSGPTARDHSGASWNCAPRAGRFPVPDRFASALCRSLPRNLLGKHRMGGEKCSSAQAKAERRHREKGNKEVEKTETSPGTAFFADQHSQSRSERTAPN